MPPHCPGDSPWFVDLYQGNHSLKFLLQGLPSREMLDGMASAKDVHTALRDALKVSVRWQQIARSREGVCVLPKLSPPWAVHGLVLQARGTCR